MLGVSDEDKKIDWKSYHKLLNTGFAWDMNILSQEDAVGSLPCLTNNE